MRVSACFICILSSYGILTVCSSFVATTSVDISPSISRSSVNVRHFSFHLNFTFKGIQIGLHKYSERVYEACIESFCALPIVGLLDGKFFCVHGGISPELNVVADINRVRISSTHVISFVLTRVVRYIDSWNLHQL